MKKVYAPGCALMLHKPELAAKIKDFLNLELGDTANHTNLKNLNKLFNNRELSYKNTERQELMQMNICTYDTIVGKIVIAQTAGYITKLYLPNDTLPESIIEIETPLLVEAVSVYGIIKVQSLAT